MAPLHAEDSPRGRSTLFRWTGVPALALLVAAVACGSSGDTLPTPRPLIVHSGARLNADRKKMDEVDGWIGDELAAIQEDPSFLVRRVEVKTENYPWQGLEIAGDTVSYRIQEGTNDAATSYEIYAHLRLMEALGRLDEWIPDAPKLDTYGRERAIVSRTADSWLYGRAIFDAQPYGPLDELIYARAAGWLDALILTAEADRFPDKRAAWLKDDPGGEGKYRSWFQETFSRNPPGMRSDSDKPGPSEGGGPF